MTRAEDIEARNSQALAKRDAERAEGEIRRLGIDELLAMPPYTGFVDGAPLPGVAISMFVCENDDGVALRWMWEGAYERMSIALWTWLARDSVVVVDVGAHTGVYSLAAGAANPSAVVVSLEPHTLNHARLVLNLRANGLTADHAFNVAVSETQGTVMFGVNSTRWYLSQGGRVGTEGAQSGTVYAVNLDQANIQQKGRVSLVKIDTEGHELPVLRSMPKLLAACEPDLLIECIFDSGTAEIESLLRAAGYGFYVIDDDALTLEATDTLKPFGTPEAPVRERLNRFVTKRPAAEVEALAEAVRAALGGDG